MIFSPSFVGFPAMFISESAPDEPARIIAGQITCPQGTQTLFDFFCTRSRLPIVHNIFEFGLDHSKYSTVLYHSKYFYK